MKNEIVRKEYLGLGWFASEWKDGSVSLLDTDTGDNVHLTSETVKILALFFKEHKNK